VGAVFGGPPAADAALTWLASAVDHGRAGTGAFLWFGRDFPELDMQLDGSDYEDHQFRAELQLFFAVQREGHCFVAPPELRVAFNGHPMEVQAPGHENRHGGTGPSGI